LRVIGQESGHYDLALAVDVAPLATFRHAVFAVFHDLAAGAEGGTPSAECLDEIEARSDPYLAVPVDEAKLSIFDDARDRCLPLPKYKRG